MNRYTAFPPKETVSIRLAIEVALRRINRKRRFSNLFAGLAGGHDPIRHYDMHDHQHEYMNDRNPI